MKENVLPTYSVERNVLNLGFKRHKLHGIPRHCIQARGGRSENGTFWWRTRKECCMRFMHVLFKQLRQRLPNNYEVFWKIFLLSIANALEVSNVNSDTVTVIYFNGEIFHLLISRMSMILRVFCAQFWNIVLTSSTSPFRELSLFAGSQYFCGQRQIYKEFSVSWTM